jgi:hypothetical protein
MAIWLDPGCEGKVIKSVQVAVLYVDELRWSVVPESLARQFPDGPFVVGVSRLGDPFGLRGANSGELLGAVILGSGTHRDAA